MKLLITGGAGFIGSNYLRQIVSGELSGISEITVVDKLTYAGNLENFESLSGDSFNFVEADICDFDLMNKLVASHDAIVNFAAESHVDRSISSVENFVATNISGTANLLTLANNHSLSKFVQISTDEVYGDMDDHFAINHTATEEDNIKPSSYYSSTKAASDVLVISANRTYGLPYLITRTCNNFGEHQFEEKFLPTITRSINKGKAIPVYGDGKQIREWMYVYDNVKVICDLMFDDEVINQVFNIGTRFRVTNLDIINQIGVILNKKVKIKHVEDRLGHDKKYGLNSSKMENYYRQKHGQFPNFLNLFDYLKKMYGYEMGQK